VVICAGGGGIPTAYRSGRELVGVEAVIDKNHAGSAGTRVSTEVIGVVFPSNSAYSNSA
jgi:carbamate kinase